MSVITEQRSRPGKLPKPPRWPKAGDSIGDWGSARNDRIALGVIGATILGVVVLHPAWMSSLLLIPVVGAFTYFGMAAYQRHWSVMRFRGGKAGTVVRSDPSDSVFYAVAGTTVAAGFALYAGLGAAGFPLPDLVVHGKRSATTLHAADNPARTLIFAALFGMLGLGALVYGRVYKAREHLVMTPEGIEVKCFPHRTQVHWDEITDVTDGGALPATGGRWRPAVGGSIVLTLQDGPPVVIDAAKYAPKSSALYWMIRHYWTTPQHRRELAGGVALRRLMREEFPCD